MTNSLPKLIFMSLLLMGAHVLAEVALLEEIRNLRLQGRLDDARLLADRELEAGELDQQLAIELNSERMNQLSYDIQVNEEQRNYVAAECGPMFTALFGS